MESLFVVALVAAIPALIVGSAVVLSLAGVVQFRLSGLLSPEGRAAAVLTVVAAGAILSIALTSRTLDDVQLGSLNFIAYDDYAKGFAASRWFNLALVAAAFIEIVRGAVQARRNLQADPAWPVLGSMLAFYGGTLLVQAVASEHPAFPYKDLYLPAVLLAVGCQRVERLEPVIETAKWTLFALTAGSLAGMVVAPDFVLHRPEPGWIPGIDWRLYGLTGHANALGPAALLAIVLELHLPSSRRTWRGLQLGAAAVVLLLAQSRTAWAAMLVLLACVAVPLALRPAGEGRRSSAAFRRSVWVLVACLIVIAALALGLVALGGADAALRSLDLGTMNGRVEIWDITLRAWRENLLFGYGAEVWGADRQWRFQLFHVGHAHNQFVQTLGEAGLAGLALLLLYLAVLLRAALVHFDRSRGLLLSLLLILLVRFVTEAPMHADGPLSWPAFLQVLIVLVACHSMRGHGLPLPAQGTGDPGPVERRVALRTA